MASDASGIDYDPRGGLQGTGRWYAHGGLWFEIDEEGSGVFVIYRCHPIPDDDWDGDYWIECSTRAEAVAAIEGMIAEETGDGE